MFTERSNCCGKTGNVSPPTTVTEHTHLFQDKGYICVGNQLVNLLLQQKKKKNRHQYIWLCWGVCRKGQPILVNHTNINKIFRMFLAVDAAWLDNIRELKIQISPHTVLCFHTIEIRFTWCYHNFTVHATWSATAGHVDCTLSLWKPDVTTAVNDWQIQLLHLLNSCWL